MKADLTGRQWDKPGGWYLLADGAMANLRLTGQAWIDFDILDLSTRFRVGIIQTPDPEVVFVGVVNQSCGLIPLRAHHASYLLEKVCTDPVSAEVVSEFIADMCAAPMSRGETRTAPE